MAGEERRDKTQVYLERIKALEERAKVALGAAAGLASILLTLASIMPEVHLPAIIAALWSVATLVTASAYSS